LRLRARKLDWFYLVAVHVVLRMSLSLKHWKRTRYKSITLPEHPWVAVVGALYASGLSADQVREKLFSVDWGTQPFVMSPIAMNEASGTRALRGETFFRSGFGCGTWRCAFTTCRAARDKKLALALNELTLETATVSDFDELQIPFSGDGD